MKAKSSGQSTLLLLDVVQALNKLEIPYAIVGAFAASFYGVIRASIDADVVISLSLQDKRIEELIAYFRKQDLKVALNRGDFEDPIAAVITIEDKFHNKVDLLLGLRGMKEDVFERTVVSEFKNACIHFISLEDFIAMKIFAGSPIDIQDAAGVLKISFSKIKLPLLKKITLSYGKKEFKKLEDLLK